MSREKQIEEMAKIIDQAKHDMWVGDCPTYAEHSQNIAKYLYNAGYRKQRVGEWETIPHYKSDTFNAYSHICKVEGCGYFYKDVRPNGYKFCPNCGAHMKGGA